LEELGMGEEEMRGKKKLELIEILYQFLKEEVGNSISCLGWMKEDRKRRSRGAKRMCLYR
jgi:hypothetical protein